MPSDAYAEARTMYVRSKRNEMERFNSPLLVHNDEDPCSHAPTRGDVTDLITATVGVDVNLCSHCEWPEEAEQVLRDEDSLWEDDDD